MRSKVVPNNRADLGPHGLVFVIAGANGGRNFLSFHPRGACRMSGVPSSTRQAEKGRLAAPVADRRAGEDRQNERPTKRRPRKQRLTKRRPTKRRPTKTKTDKNEHRSKQTDKAKTDRRTHQSANALIKAKANRAHKTPCFLYAVRIRSTTP